MTTSNTADVAKAIRQNHDADPPLVRRKPRRRPQPTVEAFKRRTAAVLRRSDEGSANSLTRTLLKLGRMKALKLKARLPERFRRRGESPDAVLRVVSSAVQDARGRGTTPQHFDAWLASRKLTPRPGSQALTEQQHQRAFSRFQDECPDEAFGLTADVAAKRLRGVNLLLAVSHAILEADGDKDVAQAAITSVTNARRVHAVECSPATNASEAIEPVRRATNGDAIIRVSG
jgi:hypothetical protein